MINFEKYKWPMIIIIIIIVVLMIMITVGFILEILSEDPDGLERALIDAKGEDWLEGLPSPWDPILGGIKNDYIAGILGIVLSVILMTVIFYLILYIKKEKSNPA